MPHSWMFAQRKNDPHPDAYPNHAEFIAPVVNIFAVRGVAYAKHKPRLIMSHAAAGRIYHHPNGEEKGHFWP